MRKPIIPVTVASLALLVPAPAQADSPPPGWTNLRILDCGGETIVTALTPAGFGTPFHVVGSDEVLIPKHVEVVFPGETEPVTTLSVPGFTTKRDRLLPCRYVDPRGLAVSMWVLRS